MLNAEQIKAVEDYKTQRANAGKPVMNDDDEDLKEYLLKVMGVPAGQTPRENAAKCVSCGHSHDGDVCDDCKCSIFIKPRENADISFVYCKTCDENIDISKKASHEKDGHKVEVTYKPERKNSRGQFATKIPMRFIAPGLVNYKDTGNVMVDKPVLDRMSKSFEGKPIFNEMHKDVSRTDFTSGRADGVIANVRFEDDGWYHCDALVWDPETIDNCLNKGYSLSCAYDVTQWGPGGVNNNIPYDREVLDGEYTHMAIVPNPRYERAKILINSKGGAIMGLLKWFSKDKDQKEIENSADLDKVKVDMGAGKEVPLKEMIELYNSTHAPAVSLADTDLIDVGGGKKVALKDIKADYASRQNADDEDEKKKAKDEEDRKNAEDKEKAEKDEKEKANRKNAEDHEKGEHKDKEMDNCLSCKNDKERRNKAHFDELANAARSRQGEFHPPQLKSTADKVAEGLKRYGPKE